MPLHYADVSGTTADLECLQHCQNHITSPLTRKKGHDPRSWQGLVHSDKTANWLDHLCCAMWKQNGCQMQLFRSPTWSRKLGNCVVRGSCSVCVPLSHLVPGLFSPGYIYAFTVPFNLGGINSSDVFLANSQSRQPSFMRLSESAMFSRQLDSDSLS